MSVYAHMCVDDELAESTGAESPGSETPGDSRTPGPQALTTVSARGPQKSTPARRRRTSEKKSETTQNASFPN